MEKYLEIILEVAENSLKKSGKMVFKSQGSQGKVREIGLANPVDTLFNTSITLGNKINRWLALLSLTIDFESFLMLIANFGSKF